jgi:hypothetical protein
MDNALFQISKAGVTAWLDLFDSIKISSGK